MIDRDRWDLITAQRDQREQEARDKLAADIERVLASPGGEPLPEVAPDATPEPIAPPGPPEATGQAWGSGEWGKLPEPRPDPLDDVPLEVQRILAKLLGLQGDDR